MSNVLRSIEYFDQFAKCYLKSIKAVLVISAKCLLVCNVNFLSKVKYCKFQSDIWTGFKSHLPFQSHYVYYIFKVFSKAKSITLGNPHNKLFTTALVLKSYDLASEDNLSLNQGS